jgi:hypothetical protein
MEANYQRLWLYTVDGGGPALSAIYLAILVLMMRVWIGSLTRAVVKVSLYSFPSCQCSPLQDVSFTEIDLILQINMKHAT